MQKPLEDGQAERERFARESSPLHLILLRHGVRGLPHAEWSAAVWSRVGHDPEGS